jgi:hypothetical protein
MRKSMGWASSACTSRINQFGSAKPCSYGLFADQNVTFRATSPVAGRTRVSWRIVAARAGIAATQATAPATPRKNKRRDRNELSRDKAVAPAL